MGKQVIKIILLNYFVIFVILRFPALVNMI